MSKNWQKETVAALQSHYKFFIMDEVRVARFVSEMSWEVVSKCAVRHGVAFESLADAVIRAASGASRRARYAHLSLRERQGIGRKVATLADQLVIALSDDDAIRDDFDSYQAGSEQILPEDFVDMFEALRKVRPPKNDSSDALQRAQHTVDSFDMISHLEDILKRLARFALAPHTMISGRPAREYFEQRLLAINLAARLRRLTGKPQVTTVTYVVNAYFDLSLDEDTVRAFLRPRLNPKSHVTG